MPCVAQNDICSIKTLIAYRINYFNKKNTNRTNNVIARIYFIARYFLFFNMVENSFDE
jgi:hypothetical protein